MAEYIRATGRGEPHGGGLQGDATRLDLAGAASAVPHPDPITSGRIRALYRSHTSRKFVFGFSTLGAIVVISLCAVLGNKGWHGAAAVWLALVAVADIGLTFLDRRFHQINPADADLNKWGWARAVASGARGVAWSLGPILMYAESNLATLIIPAWGLISLLAASAYTASPFFPSLIMTVVGGILPAILWLAFQEAATTHLAALLLLLSVPFISFVGLLGRRNTGALIKGQLDLAHILDRQTRQTRVVEQALAERTRFFSAASHDLRQPLQALGFYISLLATRSGDGDYREIVDRLEDCANNLERQFNSILGVAEIDLALNRAKPEPTPLTRILQRVAVSIRPEAELKRLTIRIVPTRLWANVAPELLERVLVNLAVNAVRYTTVGGIVLGVRRRAGSAELWIADTGIGIPAQHHEKIFDELYQVGEPTDRLDRGFGLGLATVRRLCTGMQWPLAFRSTVSRGSIFKVTVPLTAPASESATPIPVQFPAASASKVAVVVVDDDPLVRDAMKRLISSWGLHVEACSNGDQAMEILRSRDGAFRWEALIDFRLSDTEDGLAIANRIHEFFGRNVGTALMTAETDDAIFKQAGRKSIVVLRKPIKPIRLRAILMRSSIEQPEGRAGEASRRTSN